MAKGAVHPSSTAFREGLAAAEIASGFLPLFLNDSGHTHAEGFVRIQTAPFAGAVARSLRNYRTNPNAFLGPTTPFSGNVCAAASSPRLLTRDGERHR